MYYPILLEATPRQHVFRALGAKLGHMFISTKGEAGLSYYAEVVFETAYATVSFLSIQSAESFVLVLYGTQRAKRELSYIVFSIIGPILQRLQHFVYKITGRFTRQQKKYLRPKVGPHFGFISTFVCFLIGVTLGYLIWRLIKHTPSSSNKRVIKPSNEKLIKPKNVLRILLLSFVTVGLQVLLTNLALITTVNKFSRIVPWRTINETWATSKSKILNAVSDAFRIALSKVPELHNYKLRLMLVKLNSKTDLNAFYMPLGRSDTLTFGILGTNFWSRLFTTKEIIAVLLHEIGHALTISRVSTFTYLLYSTIVSLFQATISESQTKLRFLHTMLIDFVYGLLIAFRNMRNEIYADSFAVSCGYGEYLKKALIRLTNIYSEQSTLRDEQSRNTIVKRFVPHLEDVKDRLEQIDNEIKAHLEVQAERAKLKEKLQQSLLLQQKQK